MDNIRHMIEYLVGVIVITLAIGMAFKTYNKADILTKIPLKDTGTITENVADNGSKNDLNKQIYTGAEVIYTIKEYATDIVIVSVKTTKSTNPLEYGPLPNNTYNISNKTDSDYIEPAGNFSYIISVDSDNRITRIDFVQL